MNTYLEFESLISSSSFEEEGSKVRKELRMYSSIEEIVVAVILLVVSSLTYCINVTIWLYLKKKPMGKYYVFG